MMGAENDLDGLLGELLDEHKEICERMETMEQAVLRLLESDRKSTAELKEIESAIDRIGAMMVRGTPTDQPVAGYGGNNTPPVNLDPKRFKHLIF